MQEDDHLFKVPVFEVKKSTTHSYGNFVVYCFSINFILGVGVLGVPNAFYKGGIVAGPLVMLIVTIFAMMSSTWILETISRAQGIVDADDQTKTRNPNATQLFYISDTKFEMNQLCAMFLGKIGKIAYEIFLCLFAYGVLWSYAAVFAESMASHVPLPISGWYTCEVAVDDSNTCSTLYILYVLVFGLLVVPITCLNLTEQKLLQITLTLFRYLSLGAMIIITLIGIATDPYSAHSPKSRPDTLPTRGPYVADVKLFQLLGFSLLMPTCIYSQILHHAVPGFTQPAKDKKRLHIVYASTFLTTFIFYVVLGVVLAIYYGPNIMSTASLNFGTWRAGRSFSESVPTWTTILIYVIILFPALDVISAFPLNGIALGNNLHTGVFGENQKYMSKRWIQVLFRLLAAVPPLIGAIFVRDLSKLLSYAGLVGFIITFVIPPVLNVVSRRVCEKRFGCSKTPYTIPIITSTPMCVFVSILGAMSVVFCVVMNIYESSSEHLN
ncbi:11 TM domain-containing transmembrane protein [Acrasis kona]|uniref:11 TM domain-containing transmembrane protein n=1 Tax=Acrasis kona TaxID=1008807 RepID=A0AAW2ZD16_9EUKA